MLAVFILSILTLVIRIIRISIGDSTIGVLCAVIKFIFRMIITIIMCATFLLPRISAGCPHYPRRVFFVIIYVASSPHLALLCSERFEGFTQVLVGLPVLSLMLSAAVIHAPAAAAFRQGRWCHKLTAAEKKERGSGRKYRLIVDVNWYRANDAVQRWA